MSHIIFFFFFDYLLTTLVMNNYRNYYIIFVNRRVSFRNLMSFSILYLLKLSFKRWADFEMSTMVSVSQAV